MHRFSDANYFEGQDFWRLTGFEREVYLYAQPQTRVADFEVQSPLDSTFTDGLFHLGVVLQNDRDSAQPMTVAYQLADCSTGKPQIVAQGKQTITLDAYNSHRVNFDATIATSRLDGRDTQPLPPASSRPAGPTERAANTFPPAWDSARSKSRVDACWSTVNPY